MPIVSEQPSPYRAGETTETWAYCDGFSWSLESKILMLVYFVYADQASAYLGFPPIQRVEIRITGDEFDALMGQHETLFGAVQAAVDAHAVTQPPFAGGSIVAPGPPED